jgi:hypothetical protein
MKTLKDAALFVATIPLIAIQVWILLIAVAACCYGFWQASVLVAQAIFGP